MTTEEKLQAQIQENLELQLQIEVEAVIAKYKKVTAEDMFRNEKLRSNVLVMLYAVSGKNLDVMRSLTSMEEAKKDLSDLLEYTALIRDVAIHIYNTLEIGKTYTDREIKEVLVEAYSKYGAQEKMKARKIKLFYETKKGRIDKTASGKPMNATWTLLKKKYNF